MDEVTCPYCEEDVEINHDDGAHYDEGRLEEEYCSNCDKYFMVSASCSWSFEGYKADCLNGGEHNLEKIHGAGIPGDYYETHMRCSDCDEIIKVTPSTPKGTL